jgi:phosphinothricin acetyltransferase
MLTPVGARWQVRPARTDDAEAIRGIYAAIVLETVTSFEDVPPGADEIVRRMLAPPRLPWLVATRDGTVVGYAYAARHRARAAYRWSVEVSVYLDGSERGRGTGRRLYERLLDELRRLGYVSAYAGIALPNEASIGLHRAVGFEPVGTFRQVGFKRGAWRDVDWYQKALQDHPVPPAEPREWRP